ncbi:hypothetical protein LCGC14_0365330 [marine sediment metagenome]|uniref:Uncharacterized protein n=1 Tax=marine sediment metagenome TaxID=412755 RepID=A0A0F9TPK5_9ZZZZ
MKVKEFGKDHWSVLAYVETCCVDNKGRVDVRRLRINEYKRPIRSNGLGWNPKYGTRIKGGSIPDPSHDDWDCLEDLEQEELLELIGTMINPVFKLTDRGLRVASELREYKAKGGQFAAFEPASLAGGVKTIHCMDTHSRRER